MKLKKKPSWWQRKKAKFATIRQNLVAIRRRRHGVLFMGYAEAGLGLGESFRTLVTAVSTTSVPFAIYPLNVGVENRLIGPFMPDHYDREHRYDVNLIYIAADQLPAMFKKLGRGRTNRSYNILRTYWELPRAPDAWAPWLASFDEIWAPTRFVAKAFQPIFDKPITIIPPCIEVDSRKYYRKADFGMQEDRFYFMFSFDYFSFSSRKNPLGVVKTFQSAFSKLNDKVGLVIKSTSAPGQYHDIKTEIDYVSERDSRIIVLDKGITRPEMLGLISNIDCYVSLHRSEGFGLGMAEAMAFGKPVIGTDYSGNTDFLSNVTGFPVPWEPRAVEPGEYPWSDGQSWADPDPLAAQEIMRHVFEDENERHTRAEAGKAYIKRHYSYSEIGRLAEQRLEHGIRLAGKLR